jgi:hypothetical protein
MRAPPQKKAVNLWMAIYSCTHVLDIVRIDDFVCVDHKNVIRPGQSYIKVAGIQDTVMVFGRDAE